MVKAKLTTEIIVAKIKASPCNFETSPAELQRLKGEGIPDEIIVVMISAPKDRAESRHLGQESRAA